MNPTTNIPKWFWIALGLIVLAVIISISYCNKKSKEAVSAMTDSGLREAIKEQVKQDVFDLIPDLQDALKS